MDTPGAEEVAPNRVDFVANRLSEEAGQMTDDEHPITVLVNILEDLRGEGRILNLSLDEFRKQLPAKGSISLCSVVQLRKVKSTADVLSFSMDKRNPRLKFYQEIKKYLEEEERSRPIDEQFPFVRTDIDDIARSLADLTRAAANLNRESSNESTQMEKATQEILCRSLKGMVGIVGTLDLRTGKFIVRRAPRLPSGTALSVRKEALKSVYILLKQSEFHTRMTLFMMVM